MFVQIIFLLGVLLFLGREIFLAKKRLDLVERRQLYFLQLILLIGVLVRSFNLLLPYGSFIDEPMGAYDSWCLANFGVDSNLASYPVYLKSWGTGQSALYAYLALPFIKLFGLSEESYRLPMSLIGSFVILFFYWTLRKTQKNVLLVFCLSAFLAINPWHIMKCRFGLDCNIFPDILLIGICFIVLAYNARTQAKQFISYLLAFSFLSISAYGYGVSWFMLPFLFVFLLFFLIKKKRISTQACIVSLVVSLLIVFPLILFAFSLFTGGEQYQIGFITITQLEAGRHNATTIFGTTDIYQTLIDYLKISFKIFVWGIDGVRLNSFFPYGVFYNIISLPMFIIGLYYGKKEKDLLSILFGAILISSIPIVLFVEPSVWHWNVLWFPVIYFTGLGIYKICQNKLLQWTFLCIYITLFSSFIYMYFDKRTYVPFYSYNFKEDVKFVQTLDVDKVYYPAEINHAYALFYAPVSPYIFAKTRIDEGWPIKVAKSYGNVVIGLPNEIVPTPKTAYVIPNDLLKYIDPAEFKIRRGKHYYTVIWND